MSVSAEASRAPEIIIGVVADVQGAPGKAHAEGSTPERCKQYDSAFAKLSDAVQACFERCYRPSHLLQLGDLIDGYDDDHPRSVADLDDALSRLEPLYHRHIRPLHVIGNHDAKVDRDTLLARLQLSSSYYSVHASATYRIVVLDSTEISLTSPPDSEERALAERMLEEKPLDAHPHMQHYNSALSLSQIDWLQSELQDVRSAGQRAIIASHHPLAPRQCRPTHLAWNYEEVLEVITANADIVTCVLSGHDHSGGYTCIHGVHFCTLEAVLESDADTSYAVLVVYPDCIDVLAQGDVTPRTLSLSP